MSEEKLYTEDEKGIRTFDLRGKRGLFHRNSSARPKDIIIIDDKHKYEIQKGGSSRRIKKI